MTIRDFAKEETIGRKYHNAEKITDMLLTGFTREILNPAYNIKYKKWLNKIKQDLNAKIDIKPVYKNYTNIVPDMIGVGGVGSNILYMLEQVRLYNSQNEDRNYTKLGFFEFDNWEISNLPRIPFIPEHTSKQKSMLKYADNDPLEQDYNDPLFIEAAHNEETRHIPIGAMDLRTRKNLWDARIPFITITHKDNKLEIKLCPEPMKELDAARETYGMIDVNFLLPATHLAAFWVYNLATRNENSKVYKHFKLIEDYKNLYLDVRKQTIDQTIGNIDLYAQSLYVYKNLADDSLFDEKKINNLRLWTYIHLFGSNASKEGIEKIYELLNKEQKANDKEQYIMPTFDKYPEDIWNKMKNTICLTIEQKDVDKFLECKTSQEVFDLLEDISL